MTTPGAPECNVMAGFAEYFEELDDPRSPLKTQHPLLSVLMITVLGVLCGAEGWVDLAVFARAKHTFLTTFVDLPHGPPGKDTFRRLFEALAPSAFRQCFLRWVGDLVGALADKHVAIDGKTLRAALAHRDVPPLHLVHAWVVDHRMLFAQVAGSGKGQELATLPDLLRLLDIRRATVTIDALACQREIAQQILDQESDYILNVKDNQPTLHAEVRDHLEDVRQDSRADGTTLHTRTEEHGHGRHEIREAWVSHDLAKCPIATAWPGVKTLILVERTRTKGDVMEHATHCYIRSTKGLTATAALTFIRDHWGIENGLHWTLDVAMREDMSRIHDVNGAQNFALVRRIVLNALKRDKTLKYGVRAKQKNCGWDNAYLLSILRLMNPRDADTVIRAG